MRGRTLRAAHTCTPWRYGRRHRATMSAHAPCSLLTCDCPSATPPLARVLLQEDAAPLELLADGSYVPIQTVAAEEAEAAAAA